jgi:hypothetical protein
MSVAATERATTAGDEMTEKARSVKQMERVRQWLQRKNEASRTNAEQHSLIAHDRPHDEANVRAKSSGHGKKTADKWNQ